MTRRKLFYTLLFAMLGSAVVTYAQQNFEDVLYLKDGSVIHGIIIEQIPNESIKIQTKDKNVLAFKMEEVLKIASEEVLLSNRRREPLTKENIKKHGYTNITEVTLGRNISGGYIDETLSGYSSQVEVILIGLHTVNGFLFNPHFSAGLGLGFDNYSDLTLIPFFVDARWSFSEKRLTPFCALETGYSFAAKEFFGVDSWPDSFGGIMLNLSGGLKFFTKHSRALAFSLGYQYQEARVFVDQISKNPYSFGHTTVNEWRSLRIGYIDLKIAFIF